MSQFDSCVIHCRRGHPVCLDRDNCFTYAVVKASGMPVLIVGNDFSQTDLTAA